MNRLVIVIAATALAGALGTVACGGNDKPPLTPDSEHEHTGLEDAGETPATEADAG